MNADSSLSTFIQDKPPGMYQYKGFMIIKTSSQKSNIIRIGRDGIEEICNGDTSLPGISNSKRDEYICEFFEDQANRGIHNKAYNKFMRPERAKDWFKENLFIGANQTRVVEKEQGFTLITRIGNLMVPHDKSFEERDADFAGIPIKRLRRYTNSNNGQILDRLRTLYEDITTVPIKKVDKRTMKAAGLALAGIIAISTSYKLSFPSNTISKEDAIKSINQEVARHYAGQLMQGTNKEKIKLEIKKNPNITLEDVKEQIKWIKEQRSR